MIASDVTDEMLAETRALAAERGILNVETAIAAAERLPFDPATFDLVCCRLAAHHFPDPAAFVAEAARVLKPGGVFALVDNVSPDDSLLPGLSRAELRDAAVVYNLFEKLRDPSHGRAPAVAEWLDILDDAGLAVTEQRVIVKEMEFGAWVRRMQCAPETVARLTTMLAPAGDGSRGHLAQFLMPRQDDAGTWIALRELILVAAKPRA
jgi:ubiquinone/menaquinone biosynthesis C-methylase UbiE